MHPNILRFSVAILLILAVVGADQLSKAWILYDLMNPPSVIPVFPFVDFILIWNKGVSFGLFQAHTFWGLLGLITLAIFIATALGLWLWRTTSYLLLIGLSGIIGGAIGNIIDRIQFGAVVDFIYVHVYIFGHHFPAFNVADSAITAGVCLVVLESYVRKKSESSSPFYRT